MLKVLPSGFDGCCQILIDAVSRLFVKQHLVFETTVRGLTFGCCQLLLLNQRPGVSSDSLIVGVLSEFSEVSVPLRVHRLWGVTRQC